LSLPGATHERLDRGEPFASLVWGDCIAPGLLVSGETLWMGMGTADRLAGVGGADRIFVPCGRRRLVLSSENIADRLHRLCPRLVDRPVGCVLDKRRAPALALGRLRVDDLRQSKRSRADPPPRGCATRLSSEVDQLLSSSAEPAAKLKSRLFSELLCDPLSGESAIGLVFRSLARVERLGQEAIA
jgi:hypothetical protein